MRGSAWVVVPVLAVLAGGCSPRPKTAAAPAATSTAPATPAAVEGSAAPGLNAPEPSTSGPPALAPAPAPPATTVAEARVRYSPVDYGKRERRLDALIANAETRDTTGETQYRAREGRAQRARCTTRACIERSYAAEEAWLRKWEGSGDIR